MGKSKPCPFCGSKYTQVRYMGGKWQEPSAFSSGYRGECCGCYAVTAAYNTEAEAIDAWNTRAERTCHNARLYGHAYYFVCSECGWNLVNVGKDSIELAAMMLRYCGGCGAKVVEE